HYQPVWTSLNSLSSKDARSDPNVCPPTVEAGDERVEFAAVDADRPEPELPGTGEDFRRLTSHAAKARSEAAARSPASASSAFLTEKTTDVPVAALKPSSMILRITSHTGTQRI
ncbi:hypothetical protein, partial [Streptomyces sp. NPDC047000]|uniref:hypothetical protein n=1 Tax=Streptomyces sp. NPDC047000 TaxID=3155474 RepID=UPI0033DF0011